MSVHGLTDREYIEEFNLDPELEGKPEINTVMLDLVEAMNVKGDKTALIESGMTSNQADKEAVKNSRARRKQAEVLLKQVQKERGY